MVISNLNHLETVSETKEIVGGWRSAPSYSSSNNVNLTQVAAAVAIGGGFGYQTGNAVANAGNSSFIIQH